MLSLKVRYSLGIAEHIGTVELVEGTRARVGLIKAALIIVHALQVHLVVSARHVGSLLVHILK